MYDRIDVNGGNADPVYVYLKKEAGGLVTPIVWNFTKFLVVNGRPIKRYNPQESPLSFEGDIRNALGL
jgi:glutathione peroxidase